MKTPLEGDNDGFKRMERVIAERLIATKGEGILESHRENLKSFKEGVSEHFKLAVEALTAEFERLSLKKVT